MGDIAIRVEHLSKLYRIGPREPYKALRDTLTAAMYAPFRAVSAFLSGRRSAVRNSPSNSYVWALKDVSFEVKRGEVVGIIGRNGAGKTTLLKILSRVTEPTEGYAEIHGRVGSLLEVGTGFHPELTGRENIYLSGIILGMKKAEIDRKFDEIVAFAEIEKFLDTPVKYYSSGMYVRLAFAVAAHLEPEILLVDEVLAVGDAAFQKKCLGKMGEVAREGRTVLFVSHNMAAISSLCERACMLDSGKLIRQGSAQEVIQHYLQSVTSTEVVPLHQRQDRTGDGRVRAVSLQIESADRDKVIRSTSCLKITIGYRGNEPLRYPRFLVGIYDYTNRGIFLLDSDAVGGLPEVLPPEGSVTCVTDPINLTAGRCYVNLALFKGGVMADYIQYAAWFDVEAEDVYGSGKLPGRDWVLCVLRHKWFLNGG
jgi:lipopolysaccharide transport system ATP-binding protein